MPKNSPVSRATPKASTTEYGAMTGSTPTIVKWLPTKPATTPITPPRNDSSTASTTNWPRMSPLPGADRLADADLPGPLGDGHQHDVHDPDAADEQRDGGDRAEQDREHLVGVVAARR